MCKKKIYDKKKVVEDYKQRYAQNVSQNPLTNMTIFGRALFSYANPIMAVSTKTDFQQEMHYHLPEKDKIESILTDFQKNWDELTNEKYGEIRSKWFSMKKPNLLLTCMWRTYRFKFLFCVILSILFTSMQYVNTLILYQSLSAFETDTITKEVTINWNKIQILMVTLVVSKILQAIFNTALDFELGMLGIKLKNLLCSMILSKALKKSIAREKEFSVGKMLNLASGDTGKFSGLGYQGAFLLSFPVSVIQGIIVLIFLMGNTVWIPLFITFAIMFFNWLLSKRLVKFWFERAKKTDERLKLINECFNNIRFVKLNATENYFLSRICKVKEEELVQSKGAFMNITWVTFMNRMSSILFVVSLIGFYAIFKDGKGIDLKTIFTSLNAYNNFAGQMANFPFTISFFMDMLISADRINEFLISEEVNKGYIEWNGKSATEKLEESDTENVIEIKNGNFFWTDPCKKRFLKLKEENEKSKKEKKCCVGTNKLKQNIDEKTDKISIASTARSTIIKRTDLNEPLIEEKKESNLIDSQTNLVTEPNMAPKSDLHIVSRMEDNVESPHFNLSNINLTVKKGQCIALIGKVGSGKSSLMQCLFGDLYDIDQQGLVNYNMGIPSPSVKVNGSVSYVAQTSWIRSISLKDNVLFFGESDEKRYNDAIYYSCLTDDLKQLENGSETMLGDKGINLSGGQKTRLNIARAIYNDADIYLFDDPISALDVSVGKFIMDECVTKYLQGKTRIIATHAIQFLPYFDYIYIIDDGKIINSGDYSYIKDTKEYHAISKIIEENKRKKEETEKMSKVGDDDKISVNLTLKRTLSVVSQTDDGDFLYRATPEDSPKPQGSQKFDFQEDFGEEQDPVKEDPKNQNEQNNLLEEEKPKSAKIGDKQEDIINSIISVEDRASGGVSGKLVWRFLKMIGPKICIIMLILFIINVGTTGYAIWYLQYWSTGNSSKNAEQRPMDEIIQFQLIYFSLTISSNFTQTIRQLLLFTRTIHVSNDINFYMTFKLLHASVTDFWDRVPIGRVINRFSRDQNIIDTQMGFAMNGLFMCLSLTLLNFFMSTFTSSQILWVFIIGYFYICSRLQRYYMHAYRELTRLQATSQSPVVQVFTEAINGLINIQIFEKENGMKKAYLDAIDENFKNQFMINAVREWFLLRLEFLSLLVIIPGIFLCLFFDNSAGLFAVLLGYLLSITGDLGFLFQNISNTENRFISLERCCYFMDVDTEKGYHTIAEVENRFVKNMPLIGYQSKEMANNWMTKGELEFSNFSCRYRPELPQVIKNMNLKIKPGMKVGIVGRTGAGKTTLLTAIHRNFEQYDGEIRIDGHEIRDQDLKALRSRITVIPQDPHLFQDTLKGNLDPNSIHSNESITDILENFGIWEKFADQEGLEFQVEENGRNLSQGEKQLLIMARALLNKNKLILQDEATANIDIKTEDLIQKAIEKNFKDSTILMIAHRLNTIMFCNKVLVLDKGKMIEYGSTKKLQNDPDSYFGQMLQKTADIQEVLG